MWTPALALLLATAPALGKDLQGRLGVGFQAGLDDASTLTVRFGLPVGEKPINILVEAQAGMDLRGSVDDNWTVGLRALYAVVVEDNLNLYGAVGVAWVSRQDSGVLRLQPALSAEWFGLGLENLGLSAQWGLSLDIGSGSGIDLRTFGGGPGLGLNYYF